MFRVYIEKEEVAPLVVDSKHGIGNGITTSTLRSWLCVSKTRKLVF